jgi:aminoglycoside phosphotransferase (APT) family kinase protein
MHAVGVRGGGREWTLVLRRMIREPWRTHAKALLEREAGVLRQLASQPAIPTAALVAVDAEAHDTDEPALLMTRLPGRLRLDDPGIVAPLAELLVRIHGVRARARTYQSWASPERCVVPAWAQSEDVWRRAFSAIDVDPPAYRGCFLHRDFHPGNVLFDGSAISGVVDWVETSWGPPDLDVAHCSTSLALLHGLEAVEAFRAHYRAAGGVLGGDRYWSLIDALGFLPDPEKVAGPWRQSGRTDLTPGLVRQRFEAYVAAILQR